MKIEPVEEIKGLTGQTIRLVDPVLRDWDTLEAKEFYTLREVAKILRMNKKHVYERLIRRKVTVDGKTTYATRLRHHQDGKDGTILVRHRDLWAYVERMAVDITPEQEGKQP